MPGIVVGVDGSGHSQQALEWAMAEAGLRHAPLRVLTVHQAVVGYFGGVDNMPLDTELTKRGEAAAQAEADKVLANLTGPHPPSVPVTAVNGFPVEELMVPARTPTCSSSARAARAGSPGCGSAPRPHRSSGTRTARS
jgi:nucleotide-binding universal stress UspA family protein